MIFFTPWVRTFAVISHTSKMALALLTVLTLPAILLLNAGDSAAQTSSSWTYCATEGGQCNFSGTREVRYGANGNYSYGVFANGVSCNNGVFGDPLYGTVKNCEYETGTSQSSSPGPTPPTNDSSWNYCANEGGQCNFSGTREVRYGANGNYSYGVFANGVSCNNGVFGDPLYGTAKNCEYGGTSQSSSPPPNITNPTPPTNNSSWNYCASEGGQCNFSGTREVRYGANGNYAYGIFSNGVSCNNGVFGDPIYGTAKNCEHGEGTTNPTTPTNNPPPTSGSTGGGGQHYYVATNGNNSNSCAAATNINSPKRTISGSSGGLTCLATANGDWLEIRGGTYAENIRSSVAQPIASGTNWDNATVIKGYANETVTLAPTNGGTAIGIERAQYVIFADLVIDGSQNGNTGNVGIWFGTTDLHASPPTHHLRFQNIEVKNWHGNNMQASGDFSEILDSSFRDNRAYNMYGIYVTGQDNIFDGNAIFNHGGFGIHNYCGECTTTPDRNVYRFNEIYNTGYDLVNSPSALLLQSGYGLEAYGNIVRDNAYIGISVNGTNTVVSGNTIVGNRYGIEYGYGINSIIINNTIYQNSIDWLDASNGTGTIPKTQ